jgi:2-polyprenyl-3-methyl-5-hydroxy-6-metoxy-1,4-benzoquinol methylase
MNSISVSGPYDRLYKSVPENILWGSEPSHLVKKLVLEKNRGKVLDVGCGDGVNAFFLESVGFSVEGFDVSKLALNGLANRFARADSQLQGKYSQADITHVLVQENKYDVVVSCGLYQCLNRTIRKDVHNRIFSGLNRNGVVLFSCLTDNIPVKKNHLTDGIDLVSIAEVKELFSTMFVEYFKEGVIQDSHAPLVGEHEHSIVWVVARLAT